MWALDVCVSVQLGTHQSFFLRQFTRQTSHQKNKSTQKTTTPHHTKQRHSFCGGQHQTVWTHTPLPLCPYPQHIKFGKATTTHTRRSRYNERTTHTKNQKTKKQNQQQRHNRSTTGNFRQTTMKRGRQSGEQSNTNDGEAPKKHQRVYVVANYFLFIISTTTHKSSLTLFPLTNTHQ